MKAGTKTAYFDCTLQLKEGQVRIICFHPHYRGQFKDLSTKKTAVKITNFRSSDKFGRIDLIVDRKTIICEAPEKLSFQPAKGFECKDTVNISAIKDFANLETISIKAKLCELSGTKATTTRFGTLKKQVAYVADSSGSIKVILWERFTDILEEGKTYLFKNISVKKTSVGETFVNTAKTGSTIEQCEPLRGNIVVPEDLPSLAVQTVKATPIGITSLSNYKICTFCYKKVSGTDKEFIECDACKLVQNTNNCNNHWFFKGLFQTESEQKTLSFSPECPKNCNPCGTYQTSIPFSC